MAREKAYKNKCVQVVLLTKGTYHIKEDILITYPLSIHGAGQDNTIIQGNGLKIKGKEKNVEGTEGKKVVLQDLTLMQSRGNGLYNDNSDNHGENGLSFLCDSVIFTQCRGSGVCASNTKGRLINCVITMCGMGGIFSGANALIELEGSETKVMGNVTGYYNDYYGLTTWDTSSVIHLLYPLAKESLSTNNRSGQNYGGDGTIQTVPTFESL